VTGVDAAARVERVVRGVCAAAVAETGASGIIVLEDWTPEGELVYEWLVRELGESRVWRAASLASNVQGLSPGEAQELGARRAAAADDALLAHPANRTALLLGGRLPAADLFPLGDAWASQVEELAGRWSAEPAVEALAGAFGGVAAMDDALRRAVEGGEPGDTPQAAELARLYGRGRWWRLRGRVVPKLGARTIGIDLFD
jgi:hypothetical protein